MGSWVSHFRTPPARLTVLGMNSEEVEANPAASDTVIHDLNADPRLPFADATFDAVVCCVSVDYLTRPVEVFTDVARVLRPGGPFVCTFSTGVSRPKQFAAGCMRPTSSIAPLSSGTSSSPRAGGRHVVSGAHHPQIQATRCWPCGPTELTRLRA